MTWKFWKKDNKEADTDDEIIEDNSVNFIFAKMIQIEFEKKPKKIMLNLLGYKPLDYLRNLWNYACQLSDILYDKDCADEIEIYFANDGQFPMIIIELPEHDDYSVPYFIGLVFYQGYDDNCLIKSEKLDWEFFISEDEEDSCFLYRWHHNNELYDDGYEAIGIEHEADAQSFFNAIDDFIEQSLANVREGEPRLSFADIDEDGNEAITVLDFDKSKKDIDNIEKILDNLENGSSDIRFELKMLSDELIREQFENQPLMSLQIFCNPELLQPLFTEMYELACAEVGVEPDTTILEQFKFSVHDDIISGPIIIVKLPTPITLNESHYVAIAFDQGIDGQKVLDERMVDFRYFTLEESIDECCLIEWTGTDQANFGGGYIAEENAFLADIKRIIDK